jgi:hypothetical protein
MRRLFIAALLTVIAVPAYSQAMGTGIPLNQEKEVSPEVRAKRQATEQAYKQTLKGIPDAKPVDPWGNMRDSGSSTPKAKPAAKKSGGNVPN